MSVASTFNRQISNKRGLAYALGLFSGLTGMATWHLNSNASLEETKINDAVENLQDFTPQVIAGPDAVNFPWVDNVDNWEYKLITMRGYFKEERVFVRRERNGKYGYLVFAPFVTAHALLDGRGFTQEGTGEVTKTGVFVNLGWVPYENTEEIEANSEPLPLIEFEEQTADYTDISTGFVYKAKYNEDFEARPAYADVTGIIRKGEQYNPLVGNNSTVAKGNWNHIDLKKMSRFTRFANFENTSQAYLERIVPSLEEEEESTYPIPSTVNNFTHHNEGPETLRSWSTLTGGLSGAGLLLMIPALLL